ncbi:unnamed protein product [Dimorphilus gyrociliatus]|uniref:Uncharacterized protein n=1 Tax=Dimorphilus gyrociliatus TaxID=2664684 RepID=A0A7I8WDM5_9ANNE|nr:unnamed protein product [Dimorphilus gyrociliatus]
MSESFLMKEMMEIKERENQIVRREIELVAMCQNEIAAIEMHDKLMNYGYQKQLDSLKKSHQELMKIINEKRKASDREDEKLLEKYDNELRQMQKAVKEFHKKQSRMCVIS